MMTNKHSLVLKVVACGAIALFIPGCAAGVIGGVIIALSGGGGGGSSGGGGPVGVVTLNTVGGTDTGLCSDKVSQVDVLRAAGVDAYISDNVVLFQVTLEIDSPGARMNVLVSVTFAEGEGDPVASRTLPSRAAGVINDSITLPGGLPTGTYRLTVRPARGAAKTQDFTLNTTRAGTVAELCQVSSDQCEAETSLAGQVDFGLLLDAAGRNQRVRLFIFECTGPPVISEASLQTAAAAGGLACNQIGLVETLQQWDSSASFGDRSVDVIPVFLLEDIDDPRVLSVFSDCAVRRVNNTPPEITSLRITSLPQRVRSTTRTLVGKLIFDYTIRDEGGEDCQLDITVTGGGATLSTADGTLSEAPGASCDGVLDASEGTTGLTSSREGEPHRFIWNSDFDIDALVCDGTLAEPRIAQGAGVSIRFSVRNDGPCLESREMTDQFILDNTLVHSIAGLLPGQTEPGETTVPAESITFETLSGIAFDANEQFMYFADSGVHAVWRMDVRPRERQLERIAGSGLKRVEQPLEVFNNQPAGNALLNEPVDLEVDSEGSIYFVESRGAAVARIERGILQVLLSEVVLNGPRQLCLEEENGFLFIADRRNCRIIRYDLDAPRNLTNPPAAVVLGDLTDLDPLDRFDSLFSTAEIKEFGPNGCNYKEILEVLGRAGTLDDPTSPRAIVDTPDGLAVYENEQGRYLFVSDLAGEEEDRILRVFLDAGNARQAQPVLTQDEFPLLCGPNALSVISVVDGSPHLYITCRNVVNRTGDPVKGIVIKARIIDTGDGPQLGSPRIVAGLDPNRSAGDSACGTVNVASTFRLEHECQRATLVPLSLPREVLADSNQNLYICDSRNQRVRVIGNGQGTCICQDECFGNAGREESDGGRLYTFVGGTIEGRSPCEAFVPQWCAPADPEVEDPAISSATSQPLGMFLVDNRILYFSDRRNNRIRRVDLETGLIATVVGRERTCAERAANEDFKGDGGQATQALLANPRGMTVFPKEDLCDSGGRRIYFADNQNHRVRFVDSTGTIRTFAGSGDPDIDTVVDQNSSADPLQVFIKLPRGVAVDRSGRVFISDCRHRIVKVELNGRLSRVVGQGELRGTLNSCNSDGTTLTGDNALDAAFLGDGGLAINARLNQPSEMTFDSGEEFFYFSDSRNNRVRRVAYDPRDGSFGTITTVAGNGARSAPEIPEFPTNALDFELSFPYGVALDPTGTFLYCTETFGSSRVYSIRLRSNPGNNSICLAAGGETFGSSGDGDLPLNAQFLNPNVLQVDCAGNVYVLDSRNHRLRRFFPIDCLD